MAGEQALKRKDRVSSSSRRQRHSAILKREDSIDFFFSRGEDEPERILRAEMKFDGDWKSWTMSEPEDFLVSETDYEGANLPLVASQFGAVHEPAHQLRDPGIFQEDGRTYLLYSCAGENGICIAEFSEEV